MTVEVLEQPTGLSRRSFLQTAAPVVAAVSLLAPCEIAELLAQEARAKEKKVDVSKLSANELLKALPATIKLESGEATVEKYEAEDAKYLMIVLRNLHNPSDKTTVLPDYVQRAIQDSDKENGQLLQNLRRVYGVTYVGFEGLVEENAPRWIEVIDKLERLDNELRRVGDRLPEAERREAQMLRESLIEDFKKVVPFEVSVASLLKRELKLVPIERRATLDAGLRPDATLRIVEQKREEVCLELLSEYLAGKANRVNCVWGAGHWDIDSYRGMPRTVYEWNIHPRHDAKKFSAAIITPPSVKKYYETREREQKKQ